MRAAQCVTCAKITCAEEIGITVIDLSHVTEAPKSLSAFEHLTEEPKSRRHLSIRPRNRIAIIIPEKPKAQGVMVSFKKTAHTKNVWVQRISDTKLPDPGEN